MPTLETNLCEEIARHVTMQSELDSAKAERKTIEAEAEGDTEVDGEEKESAHRR